MSHERVTFSAEWLKCDASARGRLFRLVDARLRMGYPTKSVAYAGRQWFWCTWELVPNRRRNGYYEKRGTGFSGEGMLSTLNIFISPPEGDCYDYILVRDPSLVVPREWWTEPRLCELNLQGTSDGKGTTK